MSIKHDIQLYNSQEVHLWFRKSFTQMGSYFKSSVELRSNALLGRHYCNYFQLFSRLIFSIKHHIKAIKGVLL